MVGQGVLRECLLDPEVEGVLAIGRNATVQRCYLFRSVLAVGVAPAISETHTAAAATFRTASDSITRVTPLIIMLTPTSVPIAQAELDGHCR